MSIDLDVGPLAGSDDGPFRRFLLAVLEAANGHLAALGLPPHDEPRGPDNDLATGFKAGLVDVLALDNHLLEEVDGRFPQLFQAAPLALYLPVDFAEVVHLEVDGEHVALGSAPRLLFECARVLTLIGADDSDLKVAVERFGAQRLAEPLPGFPEELPLSEYGEPVGVLGCGQLLWAAGHAVQLNASVYVH
ncbi:hypothetical protein [Kribbella sp. NPDC051770]|uniref:hypothetical protein n=1 Tax=Kribbella sp. NPDC051770 TaxID=3155413 RepID=UPI003431FBD8